MQTAHELFVHELSDMLDAEQKILEALSEQSQESRSSTLQSAFQTHHRQTEGQIERLHQCFELMEEEAETIECAGIKGLRQEHESLVAEDPSPDILDVCNVTAAIKVERYEISSYESLIRLAELMKLTKLVRLLKQNLREEEQTLKKMMTFAGKFKPENVEEQEAVSSSKDREEARTRPHIVRRSGPRRGKAA